MERGPVSIIDARGVYPSALDQAVKEQKEYYAGAWALAKKAAGTASRS